MESVGETFEREEILEEREMRVSTVAKGSVCGDGVGEKNVFGITDATSLESRRQRSGKP